MRLPLHLLALLIGIPAIATASEPESYRIGAERFVTDMVAQHGFDRRALTELLAGATYSQPVIDAMRRPYEAKPWRDYRALFLTQQRIQKGLSFWHANASILAQAERAFGVPPEIIVAIIGVETSYGDNVGSYPVLSALTTLGFSYPERADFFRRQLEELLLLAQEEQIDPAAARGSYAGALGKPQFIPSSYRAYAVDFDQDGKRDLWDSSPDVIGSVASYFKAHGWHSGKPVAVPAQLRADAAPPSAIAEKTPQPPSIALGSLAEAGIDWDGPALDSSEPATLIRLDGAQTEYWIGLHNFYVITRYNHSNLYAMAVFQLSQAIKAGLDPET